MAQVENLIETIRSELEQKYVFPDVAQKIGARLKAQSQAGTYAGLAPEDLCRVVTDDLQSINGDKHLRLVYRPLDETRDTQEQMVERWRQDLVLSNYGFRRLDWLAGGIGYVDIGEFGPPQLGGAVAIAAMTYVADAQAIIFDLRNCRGGDPAMVAFLMSYLMANVHHLTTFYPDGIQSWTHAYVPGPRLDAKPVYVLTSNRTFSAGEEFAYNLKALGRAVLVGETTGGGAHPGRSVAVGDGFAVFIPMGRPVNTITGTNWEGTGVEPDIVVSAETALATAHVRALEDIMSGAGPEHVKQRAERALREVSDIR